jgi:hypothetical protein
MELVEPQLSLCTKIIASMMVFFSNVYKGAGFAVLFLLFLLAKMLLTYLMFFAFIHQGHVNFLS